jgi:ABC-type multidrug transport system ATPase subunit
LKIICGLSLPDSGEVLIDSRRLSSTSNDWIGVMLAFEMLYMNLTGRQNLSYSARESRFELKNKSMDDAAHYWGLTDKLDEKVESYSYGMKTRLALARALINQPRLILLDEPTITLDEEGCELLVKYLTETQATVVVATHQPDVFCGLPFRKWDLTDLNQGAGH